jgi:2-phosphosulfolactate phosphatase
VDISFASLDNCARATDLVVVIDVVRAFTTAAYALAAGAQDIVLAGTVEEALALRVSNPAARVMGEVGGLPPPGFDYGNSPRELSAADLAGRRLVQRTSAGTQGIVRSQNASVLLAASFVCAGATARYIRQQSQHSVTFVVTGFHGELGGDEDQACAEYIAALLRGQGPEPGPYLERVDAAITHITHARPALHDLLAADAPYCTDLDRFPFAMQVERQAGLNVLTARPA